MLRTIVLLAVAVSLSSPVAIADASQAKPAQRPATKKPATAAPAKPAPPAAAPAPKPEPPPPPGVKMTTAYTQGAQVSQNTTYLQGARQRVEFPGVITLDQCDLKRSVLLNTEVKRYRVQPYPESKPAAAAPAEAADPMAAQLAQMQAMGLGQPAGQKPRGGVVTMTTTLSDTLERQTLFGLEARRIKTIVIKQSSPSACDKSPLKVEMDAWYVDLPQQTACARPSQAAAPPAAVDPAACNDTMETRVVGDVKLGFPIKVTTTTTTGEGNKIESVTTSQEVTALEIARLERALFEVPADFVEASSTAEIVPAIATGSSLNEALFGSTANGTSTAAPKKPGTIRIGILQPVNKTTRDLPNAASLREELAAKFNKSGYDAIPLAGSSASAIEQDAARLQCDFVMLVEVVEAKTSKPGKMGGVMKMTGSTPKDSHDVKIDYKLYAVGRHANPESHRQRESVERWLRHRFGAAPRGIRRPDVHGHDDGRDGHGHDEPDDGDVGHERHGRHGHGRLVRSARVGHGLDDVQLRRHGHGGHGRPGRRCGRGSLRGRHARHPVGSDDQQCQGGDGATRQEEVGHRLTLIGHR